MHVNWLAILVSAVASMIIGSIWFGPLFGKMYMSAVGMDKWSPEKQAAMKKSMMMTYVWQFIASVVMFYVFARFVVGLNQLTVSGSVMTAFWVWIGFIVPQKLGDSLWGGKMTLFWLGIGGSAVTLLATGLVIGAMH
ncbi:MAG: DUF1761 domain-containing protein [Candidatus Doudnabacteria bacterium]